MPKRLVDYPLVLRAMRAIEADNGGVRARTFKLEAEIPEDWLLPFEIAEGVFTTLGDTPVGQTRVWEALGDDIEFYNYDTPIWDLVALPVNDNHKIAMNIYGIDPRDQWLTNQVLYQFFDGELSELFTERRRR